jgi:hypothetical protein
MYADVVNTAGLWALAAPANGLNAACRDLLGLTDPNRLHMPRLAVVFL